jgi:hypothetical protein
MPDPLADGCFTHIDGFDPWLRTSRSGASLLFLNDGFGTIETDGPLVAAFARLPGGVPA